MRYELCKKFKKTWHWSDQSYEIYIALGQTEPYFFLLWQKFYQLWGKKINQMTKVLILKKVFLQMAKFATTLKT